MSNIKQIISNSEQDTISLATDFAKDLSSGDIVLLNGEVGVGKSVFARGIARSFGIKQDINSPTFTIYNAYQLANGVVLYHIDAYRIKHIDEVYDIGLDEVISDTNGICLIEWHCNIRELLANKKAFTVDIERLLENNRQITITN